MSTFCNVSGTHGNAINLMANYFQLIHKAQWSLYQYHINIQPEEESTREKKKLFGAAVHEILAGYLFDGTTMYTPVKLPQNETEVFTKNASDAVVKIHIKLVSEVTPLDYHYLQVFNLIIRKSMGHLKLQIVQRNYYDAQAKVIDRNLSSNFFTYCLHYSDMSTRASHTIMAWIYNLYKAT